MLCLLEELSNRLEKVMIKTIEVKNYRCLKYIKIDLERFQVLVGANASGKTTFLDAIKFISDILNSGLDTAVVERSSNFNDLTYSGLGGDIEFAIEAIIPEGKRDLLSDKEFITVRYEIGIRLNQTTNEHEIFEEKVILLKSIEDINEQLRMEFPTFCKDPATILNIKYPANRSRNVITKKYDGNDRFYNEISAEKNGGWLPAFKFGTKKSALGNLPSDESKFPVSTWLRSFLIYGVQLFVLDSMKIKFPSAPGQSKKFLTDGSNLPWVIDDFKKKTPRKFQRWIEHLQTALPDLNSIHVQEREEDRHKYIRVEYNTGIVVPSWLVSDGTLRMLALTLPAYLPDFSGILIVEEPENGIHPKAVETIFQSLSSIYNAQVFLATHSTMIISQVEQLNSILCFAKTDRGITDIVNGMNHPDLKGWKKDVDLSVLFAGGILG